MKLFVFILLSAMFVVSYGNDREELRDKSISNFRACRDELGYSSDFLRKLRTGDIEEQPEEAKVNELNIFI